jgi:isopenicillin-N epimerase
VEPWALDPEVVHLNHGAFGACPKPVMATQQAWRDLMESNPARFMSDILPGALDAARDELAVFVGADPAGTVFIPNATTGLGAVLGSLALGEGDRVVATDHMYNACRAQLDVIGLRTGCTVEVVEIPLPVISSDDVVDRVLDRVDGATRLVVIDQVTSPTALVFPVDRIVAALEPEVPVLVDGAHSPGMVELELSALGASFFAGNCHKWLCAPKGAGFLYVGEAWRDRVRPHVISHGWNTPWPKAYRYHALFDWTGTADYSAWLSVPSALATIGNQRPGGWDEVMEVNRSLALEARAILSATLHQEPLAPDEMIGSMAALPLPPAADPTPAVSDPLLVRLRDEYRIEVSINAWPAWPSRLLRVSAQLYNDPQQYLVLGHALEELLGLEVGQARN